MLLGGVLNSPHLLRDMAQQKLKQSNQCQAFQTAHPAMPRLALLAHRRRSKMTAGGWSLCISSCWLTFKECSVLIFHIMRQVTKKQFHKYFLSRTFLCHKSLLLKCHIKWRESSNTHIPFAILAKGMCYHIQDSQRKNRVGPLTFHIEQQVAQHSFLFQLNYFK